MLFGQKLQNDQLLKLLALMQLWLTGINIEMWMDNCFTQNKNWYLYIALCSQLNKKGFTFHIPRQRSLS